MGEKAIVVEKIEKDINDIAADFRICDFNIDENYEYVKKDFLFNLISNIVYYGIAIPILTILIKILYNFKIEGRENIEKIQKGAISISNHVLVLDCAMIGLAFGRKKKIFYTTQEESFKIPFVRKLIKVLRAIPIPKKIENQKKFIKEINDQLNKENIVHFYPEAVLNAYCEEIRGFKNGAFNFAIKNKVQILPMVFLFENPTGIRKFFKKKKDVVLKILEPINCSEYDIKNLKLLKNKIQENMKNICKKHYTIERKCDKII